MKIIISRDEQTFGPYSSEEVSQFVENGELSGDDMACWEGTSDWVPLNDLISSSNEDSDSDESEDDFDHEKMKQWEDVFIDEDDSDDDQFDDPDFPDDETPATATQPPVEPFVTEPVVEPPPVLAPSAAPSDSFEGNNDPVPPLPEAPPPPPPPSKRKKTSSTRATSTSVPSNPLTPRSKRIKGLNSRQTVIVLKGQGLVSKIYTACLIFLILFVISCLAVLLGLLFSYENIAPILENMGIPTEWFQKLKPEDQTQFDELPDVSSQLLMVGKNTEEVIFVQVG